MEQLYQQLIMDHAKDPSHKGLGESFDGESFQVNPMCGDQVRLQVQLRGQTPGQASDAIVLNGLAWDGRGCSISQASVSMMSELVAGRSAREIARLEETFMALMRSRGEGLTDPEEEEALGDALAFEGVSRYPARIKCALLGWMALKDALAKAEVGDASPAAIPEGWE